MLLAPINHWSTVINIVLRLYFSKLTTTCIVWHPDYELFWPSLEDYNVFLQINPVNLKKSFVNDVHNFTQQDAYYNGKGVYYDDWVKKFIAAIDKTNCEGFVAFQGDIPKFAETFRKASLYSSWRSTRTRFLFIFTNVHGSDEYFEDIFFKNFANILIITADFKNSSQFILKTNKYVGSLRHRPQDLINLSSFDALTNKFTPDLNLFPENKLQNLQGREIILGGFDYRPFVAVDYQRKPQYYDHAADNVEHLVHIDGTEVHILHTFCAIYNCTVQADLSEKEDWGMIFPNYTGEGLLGMLLEGKTHMAMGGFFLWDIAYAALDFTAYIGVSGITCLVPAPTRLNSWTLPLKPFQYPLWFAVTICLLLETIVLFIARHFEQVRVEELNNTTWMSSFKFGLTTALKLFVSQSTNYMVNSYTVRTFLIACYMLDIIVCSIYAGGLASILTMPNLDEAADSVERLYRHKLTWTASSYDWAAPITGTNDPFINGLIANFRVHTMNEMRSLAKTENMVFTLERLAYGHFANSDFVTPDALNRLKLMMDDIYFVRTVTYVPRLWAHLDKYNDFILTLHSSGLSKFWEWKIAAEYMNAREQNQIAASMYTHFDMGPVKLGFENFVGIILLWFFGMSLSILVFAGEWLVFICTQKKVT